MGDDYIKWLSNLSKKDIKLAGGKEANLGEMYNAKFPVPQAFVITTDAFYHFLKDTKLEKAIKDLLQKIDVDLNDISGTPGALAILKSAREPVFVSVRSSATAEDLSDASFAGQQESF